MRAWSYVITSDRGSAPNYDGPAVTLAICKPRIRQKAWPGDLVLAFNGRPLSRNPHSLRWGGIVSEVLRLEDYWSDPRFKTKRPDKSAAPDNIYRLLGGELTQVKNPVHGVDHVARDVGGRNVLIFSRAWHFGDSGPELEQHFGLRVPEQARRCEPLNEISDDLWRELEAYLDCFSGALPSAVRPKGKSCSPRSRSLSLQVQAMGRC